MTSSSTSTSAAPASRRGPFRRFRKNGPLDLSTRAKVVCFALLVLWGLVVLFPVYWLIVTSFKTPYEVDKGPFYFPFVDFQPTLDAWHYILVELGNDTIRPYINTVIVGRKQCGAVGSVGAHQPRMRSCASTTGPRWG